MNMICIQVQCRLNQNKSFVRISIYSQKSPEDDSHRLTQAHTSTVDHLNGLPGNKY